MMYLHDPEQPRYITSLLPQNFRRTVFSRLIWFALESYFVIQAHYMINISYDFVASFTLQTLFWLKHFSALTSEIIAEKEDNLRRLQTLASLYLQLQVLNVNFNKTFAKAFLAPILAYIIVAHALFIYAFVKYSDSMPLPVTTLFGLWGLGLFLVEMVFFLFLGRVHVLSSKLCARWRNSVPMKTRICFNGFRPLGIKCGFMLQKQTAFLYISKVSKLAKNLLLLL
ncbi:unnamed protein product [Allacma fusca]|uniref:Uncharacterized protein n=1 Tax=Allacma fusca TaxID=39272 RepID=A0A8J2KER7_9HEXA|nr:unnamed protein product [Allacma fusca]